MTAAVGAVASLAENLERVLDEMVATMDDLFSNSTIDFVENRSRRESERYGVAFIGLADGAWGPLNDAQRQLQRRVLEQWDPWIEQMHLLFSGDTKEAQRTIDDAAKAIAGWIHRSGHEFAIPKTMSEATLVFRKMVEPLYERLRSLEHGSAALIVVPDTNVLIRSPDVTAYGTVLGALSYTVLLVPGVLGELDEHKVNHRNPAVRTKAQGISNRIKGWRNQGDLAKGVRVQGDIWVRVEGREPDLSRTLSWLQADVVDDRIVATVLEVQRRHPTDRIVLLTGDTLMLAKADAASIPTADTPEPDP
jgi:hypothetical protein